MRSIWFLPLVWLAAAAAAAETPASTPTLDPAALARLERIVRTRGFTRGIPRDAVPAPDGRVVYFLRSGADDGFQDLWVFDVATGTSRVFVTASSLGGNAAITPEEQARRERQRQTERGITGFQVADDGTQLLVPYSGDLFRIDAATAAAKRLTETPAPEIDAKLSPDGQRIAFARGRDLVVLEIATGQETIVAHSDDANVAYGVAEFIAQEEMDRFGGHWWAPDSRRIAFTSVDTRDVPSFRVPDFGDPSGEGHSGPYAKAGDPNAIVQLHAATLGAGGTFQRLDLGDDVEYLARVHWPPGGDDLWVETQPRSQARIDVRRVPLAGGRATVVWSETSKDWVNLHDDFRALDDGRRILWTSERSGHNHLEIVTGGKRKELTHGDWDVVAVTDVDEKRGHVTFTATREGPTELHVYRVPLRGGAVQRISRQRGWHEARFHKHGHDVWVELFSDAQTPATARVCDRDGKVLGTLPAAAPPPDAAALGPAPQFLRVAGAAQESLDVRLVLPPTTGTAGARAGGGAAAARIPLVVYVYAGPGAQQVRRGWLGERAAFDQWLAAQGFAVARIDGRGVGARGHASERIYAGRLGLHELEDQVAGVRALCARFPALDPQRVGIWGWSYGGYMTLMALARAPGTFKAGVSVAPVVDWRGYDTHYTERFLGRPQDRAAAYDSSSVLTWAPGIRGRLTLVHGTGDDNVHFRESMLLTRRLVDSGLAFDLMVYPGTHMIETVPERMHLYQLVWRTFATQL